jgi:hypothetical protein
MNNPSDIVVDFNATDEDVMQIVKCDFPVEQHDEILNLLDFSFR